MSVQDILNYAALQGEFDSSGISADQNGNILELLRYLIATPATATFLAQLLPGFSASTWWHTSPLLVVGTDGNTVMIAPSGLSPSDIGSSTYTWDSTLKRWRVGNTTGGEKRVGLGMVMYPGGPLRGGEYAEFDRAAGATGLVLTGRPTLVAENLSRLGANASESVSSGWGWGQTSSGGFGASIRRVHVWRHSSNGWAVTTYDGSTASTSYESSATADGNTHLHRLEWDDNQVRLYVDGTLRITKTTNIPNAASTGGNAHGGLVVLGAESGEATDAHAYYSAAVYYK